jgi:hypothetical protein
MINFRCILCQLIEFFLDKRLVKKQHSMIAVGGHPLPDNWVYPKKLHANTRLPPCVGGPIPTAFAGEDAREEGEKRYAGISYSVFCGSHRNRQKISNYTIRRSRAGRSRKTRLRLKIFRGKNRTSKPYG